MASIDRRVRLWKILCVVSIMGMIFCGPLSAFSVKITTKGGCGSSYVAGEELETYVDLSSGAYANIWVVTSEGSWDILRNTYLCRGTHTFSGTVDSAEGTHTVYIEATNAYGITATDSCSYYVMGSSTPTSPPTTQTPTPTQEPKEIDSDGDGVPDSNDQCSNPGCDEVDSHGCPKDSDNDSIRDCDDACDFSPGSPSNNGCPKPEDEEKIEDSDGDGWSDEQEQRAGTNPYSVDTDGDGIWDPKDPNPLKAEEIESFISTGLVIFGLIVGLLTLRHE